MRLTKLKLAGFKSFVDPTSVLFPGRLVGVVGPNGCGKSNVIDAVRWVLGESKATALRGESMQDVIFNGSSLRKPVGRASVELVFDNALGRAAGQWSQYAEIAVKRVLTRDGDSSYYINNTHVRRRDVIDLFLGTGLGPRAYAIIEQGMISRIIEAKPEELRLFLEEAAGVTKYKERRRETEHRLSDARDNLARVEDIRTELGGQIERLTEQAEVAARYRALHDELARTQNLLWLLKRDAARAERERTEREAERTALRLEGEIAQLRATEASLERLRDEHQRSGDTLHDAQSAMYAANAEVARLEQSLAHLRAARAELQARLEQLEIEQTQWQEKLDAAQEDETRWRELAEHARQRAADTQTRHDEASARLPGAEEALRSAEVATAQAQRELSQAEQQARVEEAHRANAQRALDALAQRRARLEQERDALVAPDGAQRAHLHATIETLAERLAAGQAEHAALQAQTEEVERRLKAAHEDERVAQRQLAELGARREALAQLQAKVQAQDGLADWLARHGLAQAAPLWRALAVDAGWEMALEAVLRERLRAVVLRDNAQARTLLADPAPGTTSFALDGLAPLEQRAPGVGVPLAARVRCDDPAWSPIVAEWLDGVFAVEALDEVLERRDELGAGQCWVDAAGRCVARHGIGFYAADERTHGVLEREREIGALSAQIAEAQRAQGAAHAAAAGADALQAAHRERLAEARRAAQEAQQRLHDSQLDALKLNQAFSRYEERHSQIERDLAEVGHGESAERDRGARAEAELVRGREVAEALRQRLESTRAAQREADQRLREARGREQAVARELQEARFSERECNAKLDELQRAIALAREQRSGAGDEAGACRDRLAGIDEASVAESLQAALNSRGDAQTALAALRSTFEDLGARLREAEQARLKIEQGLDPLRNRIGDLRLKAQAAQLAEEQFAGRLAEARADEAQLAPLLTRELRDASLQGTIATLAADIEALGPVNLAALEELEQARTRKDFLDAQSADLNEAIGTLEDAIRRIDRETREQLKTTYDKVDAEFGRLFPELFGGGEARLVLTGEEILDAGIQVMAHPPGKKNASIHLLSGGEKALTAIALVFAIFQLNPAPFCMLDEVDAPLDDSNTVRFCDMVKRMSQQTQFVFISHNKITMEMGQQLIGVTMQESGVSRVVEVDIEEALRMREEAAA